jgi:hypothetical protein
MRCAFVLALAALLLTGGHLVADDKQPSGKQLLFKITVLEGDPLGSREAGTQRSLAEPNLVSLEEQPFRFLAGGELPVPIKGSKELHFVPYGLFIEGKAGEVKDGKVHLDLKLSMSTKPEGRTEEPIQIHTESTQTLTTVKLGEVLKQRVGKGTFDKQLWVELIVEEIKR